MFNQNSHRQNHNILNGGAHHTFQPQMNLQKHFQNQGHGLGAHHLNSQHQDHTHGGHAFGNHQHTVSGSTLSHTTPQFTPAHLQNGTPLNIGALTKPPNEHWAEQMREHERMSLASDKPHFYARNVPHVSRMANATPGVENRLDGEDGVERRRPGDEPEEENTWQAIDFGGQGLKCMAQSLFQYNFLRKIYFNHNKLGWLPPQIGEMRNLTILDLSFNNLEFLPEEIGMLTNLKRLSLYNNNLQDLPLELGSLYQLEMLGIEGNPLRHDYKERIVEHGTQELIRFLREQIRPPALESDRPWIQLDDTEVPDKFSVLSWNTLCDRAATQAAYGYAPAEWLSWDLRKSSILEEIQHRDADVVALQEVDIESYNEFFRPNLAQSDYKGVYWPKSRAQTMGEKEAKVVDGCATFYKNSKYILLDKQLIIFSREAINRPDMKGEHDIYNRVMPRDHIAVVILLENRRTGSRLMVVNVHLAWQPWLKDVKVIQVAIMMEQLAKISEQWSKMPPCKDKEVFKFSSDVAEDGEADKKPEPAPSMKYDDGTQIPLIICSDFNSTRESGVVELITQGSLSNSHSDLGSYKYGDFTRHGMSHPFSLKSSYSSIGEMPFTNYTPDFREVIDYVWYSSTALHPTGLLGEIDPEYMKKVPGFPNYHFPSDHIDLMVEFSVKPRKERKQVEADFGPSSRSSGKDTSGGGSGRNNAGDGGGNGNSNSKS
ncbi:hypothetical protein K431DRAFT_233261 [Polychaeton citri CBS 116435]|uniref:CCR4-Not complex 3'-5'-exoribonuclease subunit Ccr4 n=1 Tax=Polychaeton citri CBS 116435 TaxID=1314669 RepID=A0A9P4Q3J9_9PEZI|nr:hypothetical protein K431DRAFT_233261 [Polychaeton citri CBS 116435]